MFTLYRTAFHVGWCSIVWTVSNGAHRTGTSRSYTSNIVPEPFKVKVWWTNSCSLLINIYFRLSGLQSSFLFIHFSEGPNTCFTPHHSLDTEAIRYADAPPSRLTGRNFAPKSPLVCVNWNPIRYSSRTGAKDIRYCVNIAGSYSPRHAQSLANGREGNDASIVPIYPGLLTFSFLLFHVFFYLQITFFYFLEFYTKKFQERSNSGWVFLLLLLLLFYFFSHFLFLL